MVTDERNTVQSSTMAPDEPHITTLQSSTMSQDSGCQDIGLPDICSREGLLDYSNVSFPNAYTANPFEAGYLFSQNLDSVLDCPQLDATIWLCLALFPACPNSQGRPMCEHFCTGIQSACERPFGKMLYGMVDCSIYPDSDCISYRGCKYCILH